jgi:Cu/Ag efflux protein CusF
MKSRTLIGALAAALFAAAAHAQTARGEGEVIGINRDSGKIVLRHGAMKGIDLPPSTASYKLKDAGVLGKVSPGDKVVFTMQSSSTGPVITRIDKK